MKTVVSLRMLLVGSRRPDVATSLLLLLIVAGGAGWDVEAWPRMLGAPALCSRPTTKREAIRTRGATEPRTASPYRLLEPRIAQGTSRRAADPLRYVLAPVGVFSLNLNLIPREQATVPFQQHGN